MITGLRIEGRCSIRIGKILIDRKHAIEHRG